MISNVYAVIVVADFDSALSWYAQLLGRPADAQPMEGLAEWDITSNGGLQLVHDDNSAGHSQVTLGVDDLEAQVATIRSKGIDVGEPTVGKQAQFLSLTDPEGNTIVFAAELTS